jgi:hypothetical protein
MYGLCAGRKIFSRRAEEQFGYLLTQRLVLNVPFSRESTHMENTAELSPSGQGQHRENAVESRNHELAVIRGVGADRLKGRGETPPHQEQYFLVSSTHLSPFSLSHSSCDVPSGAEHLTLDFLLIG